MTAFTRDELDDATAVVRRALPPTPQFEWPQLTQLLGVRTWVKHENHTPVGAFKVRGGLVYLDRLRRERPNVRGIVSATRGNHGQSLAFAGAAAGLRVTVVVPEGNSPDKNASMVALGAELVVHGHDFQAAREQAAALAAGRSDLELVPSYHPDLVRGVATYARELFDAVPALDTVYVPVGMGSGISGLIGVRDLYGLATEIVGVVTERAPATALSFADKAYRTTSTAETFVDGVATRVPDPAAIEVVIAGAARIVTVSEDAAAAAMREFYRCTHNVPEPSGALALAAALTERDRLAGRVALIQTGGNVDADVLAHVLSGGTPAP